MFIAMTTLSLSLLLLFLQGPDPRLQRGHRLAPVAIVVHRVHLIIIMIIIIIVVVVGVVV